MTIFKQIAGALFIAGIIALGIGYSNTQTKVAAPEVSFKTIKGETISLAELKGQPILVTFWATDCPSCIEEIPHLISLHQQYHAQGLIIIAVAMDYDPPNHVLDISNVRQLPYKVALDPLAENAQAFGNVQFTPTSFLIDKTGMIVMHTVGKFDLPALQERLSKL